MNKRRSKQLRTLARRLDRIEPEYKEGLYRKYKDTGVHYGFSGIDSSGNKKFKTITDTIELDKCLRKSYKELKNAYKNDKKGFTSIYSR